MGQHLKKLLRSFLGIPITLIAFLFIAKVFFDNRNTIIHALVTLNPLLFTIGILFFALFFAIKSLVWIQILHKRGFLPPVRQTIFQYSLSEVKRYVPGSIFAFIGRMDAHSENVPQKETLKGIGIEALLLALSSLIFSIPAIAYPLTKASEQSDLPSIVVGGVVVLLLLSVGTFIYSRYKKTILSYFDSFLLFLLAWAFYALGCFFVSISLTYIYPANFVFILSFFVLSWLCGYILFVTPMGLGVRELVVTGSLSLFVPTSIASVIAILTRIGMVLGELLYFLIAYSYAKLKSNSSILKIDTYLAIVITLSLTYFLFFTSYTIARHDAFLTGRFDLGNMSQTVWNTAHGNFFSLTDPDGTEKISRLADHSDILLVLFAPLYLIWSDPKVLLIIQSFALAIGGIFVYLLAHEIIKNRKLSLILSISFFFNFWVHEENIFDFHAVTIGTTLLLATFYFLIRKKYLYFFIFLLLSVMTKENVFLVASVFGLYLLLKERKWILGGILTVIPTLIFFYLTSKAIPNARGAVHFALSYYSYIGDSTQGILKNIIVKPQLVLSHLVSLSSLNYLHQTLIPTGYLALLSPLYLLFTLPDLAINLLSTNVNLRSYEYHYGAIIIPFVYISTMYGIVMLTNKVKKPFIQNFLFYYILVTTIVACYFYSPLPGMKNADYGPYITTNSGKIREYLSLIPDTSSVSASNDVGAHLSHRENIYVFPNAISSADVVVLYREKPTARTLINEQLYDAVISDKKNDFYLFKKRLTKSCTTCKP